MSKIRKTIEEGFESYGKLVFKFHKATLVIVLLFIGLMVLQVPQVQFDPSTEGFFHEEDPSLIAYNDFRDQFGRDEMIILMIKSDHIFSLPFFEKLLQLHEQLENEVPFLNDINSLINARSIISKNDELIVKDLLEEFPETEKNLIELKEYILTHPLYKNLIISEDGKYTALVIKTEAYSTTGLEAEDDSLPDELDIDEGLLSSDSIESNEITPITDAQNSQVIEKVGDLIDQYQSDDFRISLSGSPTITAYLKQAMQTDMKRFTLIAILIISVFLFLLFRRISGVALPLLTVILSVVSTIGLMAWMNTSIKLPTMILPSFLLAVGVGASVHLMAMFYKHFNHESKEKAIILALGHSGMPIFMTSITTAVGLLSFGAAEVAAIADLGVFAASGVFISLFLTLTLIPAMLSAMKIRPSPKIKIEPDSGVTDRILTGCGHLATSHPYLILTLAFALILGAGVGISKLRLSHHILHWFPADSEIRQNTNQIDHHLKGSVSMEVLVKTKKENGLYDPKLLKNLDQIADHAKIYKGTDGIQLVAKSISLSDTLKEIHQALNKNNPEFYIIPDNRQLIAQEFLLFENSGSDDLANLVDSQFSETRLTIKLPWRDATTYVDMINDIKNYASRLFGPDIEIVVTGMGVLLMETINSMMNSTVTSYSIAAVVISILMILLIGQLKLGLASMIPNLFPIILTLGLMGWLEINLDMFTLLIGSIAIGLAVDDTIHFFHNFRKYHEQTENVRKAVEETLLTAGRAMLVTTLVLATGFWIFMLATLNNVFYFGLLTGITLVFAFLADVLLAPAILTLMTKDSVPIPECSKKAHCP